MFKSYWDNYYNAVLVQYYCFLFVFAHSSGLMS